MEREKKTIQDTQIEIQSLNKTQTEIKLKIKNLGSQTKILRGMEEKLWGIEDKLGEMGISVQKIESQRIWAQNVHEIWDTIERPNLQMIGIKTEVKDRNHFQQYHRRKYH